MDTQESMNEAGGTHAQEDTTGGLPPLGEARRAFEREYLVRLLTMTAGNVTHAARLAGRNRTEFYRLLERHRLSPASFKQAAALKPLSAP